MNKHEFTILASCFVMGIILFIIVLIMQPIPAAPALNILTDPETNCEYVSYQRGGIFPRMDRSGNQVGCR